MTWLKLHTDILDDVKKTRKLSPNSFQIFIFLLLFAKELDANGEINLSLKDIEWRLRVEPEILKNAISDLEKMEILSNKRGVLRFINWTKRNYADSTERVKKHRMKRYNETLQRNTTETSTRSREQNRTETETETEKEKTLCENDISHLSLRKWFDEVMWPSVPKKVGKDLTWSQLEKLKPDPDTRTRIVEYFKSYSSVAATYPPGQFFPEMQDSVRVIKNKRYLDELVPYGANGSAEPQDRNQPEPTPEEVAANEKWAEEFRQRNYPESNR